jgi:hypothetical protein
MIRKVYCIESFDIDKGELIDRLYARNLKIANRIKRMCERRGYEVLIHDYTNDYKNGAPILPEWIEGLD